MINLLRNTLGTARVSAFIFILILEGCGSKNQVNPNLSTQMPQKILWAWERPEDLRFLDPKEFGVAFLAQTIFLEKDDVLPKPRRQPLDVSPGTFMIAVTRIESKSDAFTRSRGGTAEAVTLTQKIVELVNRTLDLPDVKAIQVDFDAVSSERGFYRKLMIELRNALDKDSDKSVRVPLTMTSLASWCTGDAWFNDFPVDEAVPMVFQMGTDEEKIKNYLRNGNDWHEPLCCGSYGISIENPLNVTLKPNRRIYYFKNSTWIKADIEPLR